MRVTLTYASLPSGPMITQYGVRAPITLDSDSLGYPQNYGRDGWNDSAIPRTANPVRFLRGAVVPFGRCWGLRNRYAVTPSRIVR